jgi:hypothetical protein
MKSAIGFTNVFGTTSLTPVAHPTPYANEYSSPESRRDASRLQTARVPGILIFEEDKEPKLQTASPGLSLSVSVIFTSMNWTLKALEKALQLANRLHTGIEILVLQVVPFALPLDKPPVQVEIFAKGLEEIASRFPGKTQISVYLCRDRGEALKRILNRNYPVVMGFRKRWWPSRDERLARELRRGGYDVQLVETE